MNNIRELIHIQYMNCQHKFNLKPRYVLISNKLLDELESSKFSYLHGLSDITYKRLIEINYGLTFIGSDLVPEDYCNVVIPSLI